MKPTKEDFLKAVAKTIVHHTDGMTRTEKNYKRFETQNIDCALCNLFGSQAVYKPTCINCPLYQHKTDDYADDCAKEFRNAIKARNRNDYPAFIVAETALVERLKSMLYSEFYDEFYGKEREADIPDFAKFVYRKGKHYYYYMGVFISNLYILTYNIHAKRTNVFNAPSNISDFLSGYIFDDGLKDKYYPPFGSNNNIDTIKEQFATYCKSLEKE